MVAEAAMIASVVGTLVSVAGSIQAGNAAQAKADYEARLAEMRGNEAFAVGQRKMLGQRKEKEVALSALQARAAASSGDTTDAGVVTLGAGIEEQGEYKALTEFYRGENAKRGYQDAAAGMLFEGEQAKTASYYKAAGTLLSGASMAARYGSAPAPASGTAFTPGTGYWG